MNECGNPRGAEKTIAILGNRWWPQAAKQEGGKTCYKVFNVIHENNVNERPTVGGVSIRSLIGAP